MPDAFPLLFLVGGDTARLRFWLNLPHTPSIHGGKAIVYGHAEVGIQSCLVIQKHIYCRHNDAGYPKVDACLIFKVEIGKTNYKSNDV
jgi:hypothetical protein